MPGDMKADAGRRYKPISKQRHVLELAETRESQGNNL